MNKHPYCNQACNRDPKIKTFKEMGVCASRVYITRTASSKDLQGIRIQGCCAQGRLGSWGGLKVVKTPPRQ